MDPLDYFQPPPGPLPLDGPLFRSMSAAVLEALLAWGLDRPQNLRLEGVASGRPGSLGGITARTSRVEFDTFDLGQACAGMSPLAATVASSLSEGCRKLLAARGGYRGIARGVASGLDESRFSVLAPQELEAALSQKFGALGIGGPGMQPLVPDLARVLLLTLQRGKGFAAVEGDAGLGWVRGASMSVLTLSIPVSR